MAYSHVAHDCTVGDGVIMANSVALSGHVEVQDKAIIGGLSGIHQFCVVGTLAFIGGMSRISMDVLPYMMVEGNPARCHGPNAVGLERNGFDSAARTRIRKMYKLLYRSGLNTTQALARIREEIPDTPERQTLLAFVARSERGLTK
jgi:UDP-N-acetylglucosamine acyltransferase